jgi:membrane associated rhomboid family serine protease
VSTGGPDLFVICKSCGSEVSPYITECPYCGTRLRKRAPKIDRDGRVSEKRRRRRTPAPVLPRLRRGEIPGIRADARPYATIVLVLGGITGCLLWQTSVASHIIIYGSKPESQWWRVVTSTFVYNNAGFAFAVLGTIALYGWLMERRQGPLAVLALFAVGGIGGTAATTVAQPNPVALGAQGAALALLVAWAIPDLLSLRSHEDIEGDMLGTAAIALVVILMPLAVEAASWIADGVGIVAGLVIGLPIAHRQLTRP